MNQHSTHFPLPMAGTASRAPQTPDFFAEARAAYRDVVAKQLTRRKRLDKVVTPLLLMGRSAFELDVFAEALRDRLETIARTQSTHMAIQNISYGMDILDSIGKGVDDAYAHRLNTMVSSAAAKRLKTTRNVYQAFNAVSQLVKHGTLFDHSRTDALEQGIIKKIFAGVQNDRLVRDAHLPDTIASSLQALDSMDRSMNRKEKRVLADAVNQRMLRAVATADHHADILAALSAGKQSLAKLHKTIDAPMRKQLYAAIMNRALGDIEKGTTVQSPDDIQSLAHQCLRQIGVSKADSACAMMLFPRAIFRGQMAQSARLRPGI